MIRLGEVQKLQVIKHTSIGAYLNAENNRSQDNILLPQKQVTKDMNIGDEVEVFVYKDSKDRLIATTKQPKITLGNLAVLKVVDITKIGAFLDWGLEKDLLLPFKEQTHRVTTNRQYLVSLYIDKSDRLCATMKVYELLSSKSPYQENDKVYGIVYDMKKDMGAFVAVDNKYHGLIPSNELFGDVKVGDSIEGRVTKVREDGKLALSVREKAYIQMDEDAKIILEKIKAKGGKLFLHDHSDPEKIKQELNMSKNAFKRAVGRLLKGGKIRLDESGIELISKE